jgi:LysM repeat protein
MFLRQRILFLLIVTLGFSLALVGCVRTAPGGGETTAVTTPDLSDPNVGGGVMGDLPTEVPTEAPTEVPTEASAYPPPGEAAPTEPAPEMATAVALSSPTPLPSPAPTETMVPPTAVPPQPTPLPPAPTAPPATGDISHVVQSGENLFRIGLQYGLSWVTIAQYNGITDPNAITAGQTIRIPASGTQLPTPSVPQPTPTPSGTVTLYVVQPGDNLYRIGLKFGISWVQIAEANGLDNPNQVYAGQTLKIPASLPGPTPEFTHIVRQGETIFRIAQLYGVPWTAIAEANEIESPYTIYAGQTLIIPGS